MTSLRDPHPTTVTVLAWRRQQQALALRSSARLCPATCSLCWLRWVAALRATAAVPAAPPSSAAPTAWRQHCSCTSNSSSNFYSISSCLWLSLLVVQEGQARPRCRLQQQPPRPARARPQQQLLFSRVRARMQRLSQRPAPALLRLQLQDTRQSQRTACCSRSP